MLENNYIEVRCPGKKKHTIKRVEFGVCGSLLGGLTKGENCTILYRCPSCGFWEVVVEDENITYNKIDTKDGKIEFERHWRIVNDG